MELHLSVDKITKEEAENIIGDFSKILEDKGFPVESMEVSETVETGYKLKDKEILEERFFSHVLVKRVDGDAGV